MRRHRPHSQLPAFFLGLLLAVPSSALALRAPNPQEAGTEELLRAGLEEGAGYELALLSEVPGLADRMEQAYRLKTYQGRLVKREGRYFLVKSETPTDPEAHRSVWETVNNPIREYAAFWVARALGCNVCDVIIPPPDERKQLAELVGDVPDPDKLYLVSLSTNYSLKDDSPQILQRDPDKAVTRRVATAVFERFWDFHGNNAGPVKEALEDPSVRVRMGFDGEQAFHSTLKDVGFFTARFILNYFSSPGSRGEAGSTNEEIVMKGRAVWFNPLPLLEQMDEEELKAAFRSVKQLKLDDLEEEVREVLLERYPSMGRVLLDSQLKPIFNNLKHWQQDYHRDIRHFLYFLARGITQEGSKRVVNLSDRDDLNRLRALNAQLQNELAAAQREMNEGERRSQDSKAGLEEPGDTGERTVLPYGANLEVGNILRGLELEDTYFGERQVSKMFLAARARARREGRQARFLIVGAGAIVFDVQRMLGTPPGAELVFINKRPIELSENRQEAAQRFAREVVLKRIQVDPEQAVALAEEFLDGFRNQAVIHDVNRGLPINGRFQDESFDGGLVTAGTFDYPWEKVLLFREMERVTRTGASVFVSNVGTFSVRGVPRAIFFNRLPGNEYTSTYHHVRIDKKREGISFPDLQEVSIQPRMSTIGAQFFESTYALPEELRISYERLGKWAEEAATVAESAAPSERRQVAIVDIAGLQHSPGLVALLAQLNRLAPRTVVLGFGPLAHDLRDLNPHLHFTDDTQGLISLLEILRQTQGMDQVTYLGPAHRVPEIRAIVQRLGLEFSAVPSSVGTVLAGLGVPVDLAQRLAAGLEEAQLLGAGA